MFSIHKLDDGDDDLDERKDTEEKGDDDDDQEPDDILNIHKIVAKDNEEGYWVQVTEVKDEVEKMEWRDAVWTHDFCQLFVDDPNCQEKENYLVEFASTDLELIEEGFHAYLAREKRIDVSVLFPKLGALPSEETASHDEATEEEASTEQGCGHDHDSANNYKEVISDYYFQKDRRYSTCSCRKCGKYFATDTNKAQPDYANKGHIPLPKGGKNSCYACTKFEPGTVLCLNMICTPCITGMSTKKRRRPKA